MTDICLQAKPLTMENFRAFGEVIETAGRPWRSINDHTAQRFDDLARIDVLEQEGRPLVSVFEASPCSLPLRVRKLERHPLSSQAFYPLDARPFLIVVAEEGSQPISTRIRAFHAAAGQGVNYRRNTWHHSLLALGATSRFLVIDRGGAGENCEEIAVDGQGVLINSAPAIPLVR